MAKVPRVFLSYSHDSEAHKRRVLDLAVQLRAHGCKVRFDQFEPAPPDGWNLWMETCLDPANTDFVLMVCSEGYLRRIKGEEDPGTGNGVRWEGRLIYNRLYGQTGTAARYIPGLLTPGDGAFVPGPVKDHSRYEIRTFDFQDDGYDNLYRHITDQPKVRQDAEGELVPRPPWVETVAAPGGEDKLVTR